MARKLTRDTSVNKKFAYISIEEMRKGIKKGVHPSVRKAFQKEIRDRNKKK